MSSAAEKSDRLAIMLLLLLVLANALAAGLRTVTDFDMGWHLATGRWVVQHHAVPELQAHVESRCSRTHRPQIDERRHRLRTNLRIRRHHDVRARLIQCRAPAPE